MTAQEMIDELNQLAILTMAEDSEPVEDEEKPCCGGDPKKACECDSIWEALLAEIKG